MILQVDSHDGRLIIHGPTRRKSRDSKEFAYDESQLSNEEKHIGDEILPCYVGIIIKKYKDPD